jgi:light-harvesting complex 1 alpha chain
MPHLAMRTAGATSETDRSENMHRVWMWVHPLRIMTGLYAFLAILAFMIHFILMSTDRYNWFLDSAAPKVKKSEIQSPMPPLPTKDLGVRFG